MSKPEGSAVPGSAEPGPGGAVARGGAAASGPKQPGQYTHKGGILVTGATGNVGSEVCNHLANAGVPVYAAVNPRRLTGGDGGVETREQLSGTELRGFDFTGPGTWRAALDGVRKVFLMRPPHISNVRRDINPFLEYLSGTDVDHVVFLSVQGAENNRLIPHNKIERKIMELEIAYTFIRPSFFMQNLTTTHLAEVRDESMIFVPAGDGVTNFIDVRDIGEVASKVLVDVAHKNKAYTVTGDASYSYHEVVRKLSRSLGRTITYKPARAVPFLRYHLKHGRRLRYALVMYALYSVMRLGKVGAATDTFEKLVGRRPRSLDEFIDHHRTVLGAVP